MIVAVFSFAAFVGPTIAHLIATASGDLVLGQEGVQMQDLERDEKHILMLELLAASSIFFIAAIVLYVVFQYRPL